MLFLPGRERIEAAFDVGASEQARRNGDPDVLIQRSAVELSYEERMDAGRVKCLTVTYWTADGRNRTLEHVVPSNAGLDDFLAGAKVLGRIAQQRGAPIAYRMAAQNG